MKQILLSSLFIIVFFLFNSSTSIAQEDTTKIAFVAYWSKGDIYDFNVTKTKKKWTNDKLTTNDSSHYTARFEVLDSTATSYTIKWTYKNDLKKYNLSPKTIKKLAKFNVMEVIYKTNELGAFQGVQNWKEISNMLKSVFKELVNQEKDKRKKMETAIEPLVNAYSSKEGVEQLMFKELQYLHMPFGGEYDVTKPLEYDESLTNLVSGGVIRGEGKLTFTEVNREQGYCVLLQELKLNDEDTKNMVIELLKKMKTPEDKISAEIKNATISIVDDNRYEFFYFPGVPINISTKRESIIKLKDDNLVQVESIDIELILEE